jgi:hypothetical protein
MPRKAVDTSKPLVPMIRNPATNRYVRVDSKIGRSLIPPKNLVYNETTKRWVKDTGKIAKRITKHANVEMKDEHEEQTLPPHQDEVQEISRQIELLRQRLDSVVPPPNQ